MIFLLLCAAFFSGLHFGSSRTPQKIGICLDFADLSKEEMQEYLQLKDQKLKFEKANEILARIIQIFIADMGLHSKGEQLCKINSAEFPLSPPPADARPADVRVAPTISKTEIKAEAPAQIEAPAPAATKRPSPRAPRKSTEGHASLSMAESLGAIRALYQAILWRAADTKGEAVASEKFSNEGWQSYIRSGQNMIRGQEFLKQVEPHHTPQQIINHLYAVFAGRCAFQDEMKNHLDSLSGDGPAKIIEGIINLARQNQSDQLYAGGFSPSSCATN